MTRGEKTKMERVGDTFEMVLKKKKLQEGMQREVKWAEDGGRKFAGMEVGASEEETGDEEMAEEVDDGKEATVGFRRRVLSEGKFWR